MATEILQTSLLSRPYVLTSEARSIFARTDESSLPVTLAYSGDIFFSVELYAYDGKVELFDPGSIVEGLFRKKGLVSGDIVVSFGPVSKSVTFLYCEYDMPEEFNPRKSLLLSSSARRVHEGSKFTFAALPLESVMKIDFKAVGLDKNGVPVNADLKFSIEASKVFNHTYIFDTAPYIRDFIRKNPEITKVLYFSVANGSRQLMCYLSPSPAWLTFTFMNIFNVQEFIDIEGAVTTKSETSRQTARSSGDIIQYDRRTDRTYQLTTGSLPADEVESLFQLVSSHSVQLFADGTYHDIVIEEHTCEESTEDDSLSVIKFTWRFKGRRPVKFNSELFGIQPTHREIFSHEYSPEYE